MGQVVLAATVLAFLAAESGVIAPYLDSAAHSLRRSNLMWVLAAVAAQLASMAFFARLQRRMLASGGVKVTLHRMVALTYAANAVSETLPAGSALASTYTYRRLRRLGASVPLAGFTLITSGILSAIAFALIGLTAGVAIGLGHVNPLLMTVEAVAVIGLAYLMHRFAVDPSAAQGPVRSVLGRLNRMLRRPLETGVNSANEWLREVGEIRPRPRDWSAGLLLAVLNWAADSACLMASCWAVGVHISVSVLIVAFLAGAGASTLSFTPGGIGVVEAAIILALTHGGLRMPAATASVALYRLISLVLVVAVGWAAWAVNGRRERAAVGVDTEGTGT